MKHMKGKKGMIGLKLDMSQIMIEFKGFHYIVFLIL